MTTETAALATVEHAAPRALITKEVLRYEAEQRKLLSEYVSQQMKENTDYGIIPGTPKPSLWKPGAEKLITLFRCTPKFTLMEKLSRQDFERGFFHYVFRCRIYSRDVEAVVAEGFGSASSYESRYRWRNASRKCPSCGKEAIIQGKPEYGGGWVCFKKKDGCGAKFAASDAAITGQQVGRVENPDLTDMANTVLKMAKKRALVDAAIALARCSDMFTQDVEDLGPEAPPEDGPPMPPEPEPARGKAQQQAQQQAQPRQAQGERRAPAESAPRESRPAEVTHFPKSERSLSPENQAKAEQLAKKLGGEVQKPGGPHDVAAAIVAEAEQVSAEDFPALAKRAKGLPKGEARDHAAAALKKAAKRLGITAAPAAKQAEPIPEPGSEG